jgi:chemotaxis protein methyltransferase CheR
MVEALKNLKEDDHEFNQFCDFLQEVSGITVAPGKAYLVSTRIRRIMQDYQFDNLQQLLKELKGFNRKLKQDVIDAMTTNETFWFRDQYPFDYFYNTLLDQWNTDSLLGHRPIRIWSAACSSGQEPYSLSMLVEEYKEKNHLSKKIEIVGTDLSSEILEKAKLGEYDKLSISRGLSDQRIAKFFTTTCQNQWSVKQNVRKHIKFQPINLLDSYINLGKFDIIFCRNVLIYFNQETKTDIIRRMHQLLNKGGLLCLGSSESLGDASSLFTMINCRPGLIYQAK